MLRKMHLATVIAIAISAGGTVGSVNAGGYGGFGGGNGGGSGGGRSHSGSSHNHGHSGGNSGGFKIGGSGSSNVIRSGNFGNSQGPKVMPKNTGIAGGIKLPNIGSSNGSNKGPSKGPSIGNVLSKNSGISSQVLKNISGNSNNNSSNKGKPSLGISIGDIVGKPGNGNGNGPGKGNGNGHGHQHHNGHNHNGHNHHNHHNHHHHCPPLVFTLPVCQPNYCPPPCPPIYYPQPYPVAVPVPVPVADPNAAPIDPNAVPAAPPMGLPMETKAALEDVVATEAPAAEAQPVQPASATTELVSKEVQLPQIPVGATLTLNGKDLTDKEGQVVLQVGDIAVPATIKEWKNDSVTCTLPVLGLTKASKATLHVLKADGKTASTLNCELVTTIPTSIEAKPTTADIEAAKYEQ
jgi:hypothetical protein